MEKKLFSSNPGDLRIFSMGSVNVSGVVKMTSEFVICQNFDGLYWPVIPCADSPETPSPLGLDVCDPSLTACLLLNNKRKDTYA